MWCTVNVANVVASDRQDNIQPVLRGFVVGLKSAIPISEFLFQAQINQNTQTHPCD